MQYILGQCRCWIERNEKKKTETIVKMRPTYSFFFLFHNNWMNAIGGMEDSRKKTLDQGLLRMWLKHILWADIFSCLSSFRRRFHNKMCVSQICVRGFHHVFLFLICLFTCIHLWWMQAEKKCLGAKRIDGPGQFGLLRDFFFCSLFDLVAGRQQFFFYVRQFSCFFRFRCDLCIGFHVVRVLQCSIVLHHVGKELFAVVGRTRLTMIEICVCCASHCNETWQAAAALTTFSYCFVRIWGRNNVGIFGRRAHAHEASNFVQRIEYNGRIAGDGIYFWTRFFCLRNNMTKLIHSWINNINQ